MARAASYVEGIVSTLTGAQVASMLGVSTRRVYAMGQEANPPPKDSKGQYPPDEFGVWFREYVKKDMGITDDGRVFDTTMERGRLTHHQANIAAMEEELRRQSLIPAEQVQKHWENLVANARAKLLTVPSRIAVLASGAASLQEAEKAAREVIHEALSELAGDGIG